VQGVSQYKSLPREVKEGGYIKIGNDDQMSIDDYKDNLKKKLDEQAEAIQEEELANSPIPEIQNLRDLINNYKKDPNYFIDQVVEGPKANTEDVTVVTNAISTLLSSSSPEDIMSPNYSTSEAVVRDFARKYLGEEIANDPEIFNVIGN